MDLIARLIYFIKRIFMIEPTGAPDLKTRIVAAIADGITGPLALPQRATTILYAQAVLETGTFKSWAFGQTNSLFNRHKGSGRGEWTGNTIYVSANDRDVRIYANVEQSARDMRQLLSDPLYSAALERLRQGNATGYYDALERAGFSEQVGYAQALSRTLEEIG